MEVVHVIKATVSNKSNIVKSVKNISEAEMFEFFNDVAGDLKSADVVVKTDLGYQVAQFIATETYGLKKGFTVYTSDDEYDSEYFYNSDDEDDENYVENHQMVFDNVQDAINFHSRLGTKR